MFGIRFGSKTKESVNTDSSTDHGGQRIRRHYVLNGSVQGVGFRYRAKYEAAALGVTGWVQNCWDGSVEMEAQGTEEELTELFRVIQESQWIEIQDMRVKQIPVDVRESGFHIR